MGRYQIEPAELHRIYPPFAEIVQPERDETQITPYKNELFEEKIRFLEREIVRLERTEADLREDRDQWRRQATSLLTSQQEAKAAPAPRPWWRWFV